MPKFRKKPVAIEAVQFTKEMAEGKSELPNGVIFLSRETVFGSFPEHCNDGEFLKNYETCHKHIIKTLEGEMSVQVDDWIITGVNGEKYPCKPDIFKKTYEKV